MGKNGCNPRNGASLLPPPYNCVGFSPRAPSVARSVHGYSSSLPRRVATRRLRVGHFRALRHSGSPYSQPRAGTHSRPLGHDGCTRVPPPRAPPLEAWITSVTHRSFTRSQFWRSLASKSYLWDSPKGTASPAGLSAKPGPTRSTQGSHSTL